MYCLVLTDIFPHFDSLWLTQTHVVLHDHILWRAKAISKVRSALKFKLLWQVYWTLWRGSGKGRRPLSDFQWEGYESNHDGLLPWHLPLQHVAPSCLGWDIFRKRRNLFQWGHGFEMPLLLPRLWLHPPPSPLINIDISMIYRARTWWDLERRRLKVERNDWRVGL